MLLASTGYLFSEKDIVEHIDFVMTDSTSHNLGVIEQVCEDLDSESVPQSLVCNIHPLMMFQRQAKKVFQIIHDAFGKAKIKDCFLVDMTFMMKASLSKQGHAYLLL